MKKIILLGMAVTLTTSYSFAMPNPIVNCPKLEQIEIKKVAKPYTHFYQAFNEDHKYFYSKEYTEDNHNGPAPPVIFYPELSSYNGTTKTLFCTYYAYTRMENVYPVLINVGDY